MHEKSKTNILKYLKLVQQVPAKSILGNEPFSLKQLYQHEGSHIITKLQKDDFISLLVRKKRKRKLFDFFNLKIKDPTVPNAIRKIIEPENKVSEVFLTKEEIDIKKTILT